MGTKLGDLVSAAMVSAADTDGAAYVNQWGNWAIKEIWSDRPWPFRIREIPQGTLHLNDTSIILPGDFDMPREFRIIGSPPTGRKLIRMRDEILRRRVSNPLDLAAAATPKYWLSPILQDTFDNNGNPILKCRVYPPADGDYPFGGSYYASHPTLSTGDYCLIPSQYDNVIIDRLRIYIKEFEDEMDITPWVNKYIKSIMSMRNDQGRSMDGLPGFKPERFLEQMDTAATMGIGRDVDLGE